MLKSTDQEEITRGMAAFIKLAWEGDNLTGQPHPEAVSAIVEAGAVSGLLEITARPELREIALSALANLAGDAEARRIMIAAGLVDVLTAHILDGTSGLPEIEILARLCAEAKIADLVRGDEQLLAAVYKICAVSSKSDDEEERTKARYGKELLGACGLPTTSNGVSVYPHDRPLPHTVAPNGTVPIHKHTKQPGAAGFLACLHKRKLSSPMFA